MRLQRLEPLVAALTFSFALFIARPAAQAALPSGEEVEILLKDGRRVTGRLLQELDSRIKIEKPGPSVESIDRADIAEILRAPDTDSRVVDILAGIEALLAGQREILLRLAGENLGTPSGAASAPAGRDAAAGAEAPEDDALDPDRCRAALGAPARIVRDCFVGTAEAGANPFPSAKWVYPPGAHGLSTNEWRSLYFVNDVLVGSVIESSGSRVRPDPELGQLLRSSDR